MAPERPYAESICRDCTALNNIKFLGKQEQMEDILPIADLFLLTSEYESFGLAALEAMAAEVPVIFNQCRRLTRNYDRWLLWVYE